MSRYDGLIIPRSYSEYINKTDAATLLQALQLSGVMDNAPTANSNHPTKSSGVYTALAGKQATLTFDDIPTNGSNNPVKSGGIYTELLKYVSKDRIPYNTLTNGQNINNLRTPGIYQAPSDSIGNSLIGRPSDYSIYSSWLIVLKTNNETMTQILIANRNMYFRTANSTTANWSDWYKFNVTNVTPTGQ